MTSQNCHSDHSSSATTPALKFKASPLTQRSEYVECVQESEMIRPTRSPPYSPRLNLGQPEPTTLPAGLQTDSRIIHINANRRQKSHYCDSQRWFQSNTSIITKQRAERSKLVLAMLIFSRGVKEIATNFSSALFYPSAEPRYQSGRNLELVSAR